MAPEPRALLIVTRWAFGHWRVWPSWLSRWRYRRSVRQTHPVTQADLLDQVRELRARGLSPKQVARELGMTSAQAAPLIRQVAGSHRLAAGRRPLPDPSEREVLGCWVNAGWSAGLDVDDATGWASHPAEGAVPGSDGLVGVLLVRAERSSRVTLCAWLVDVYCLGVKNVLGPETISSSAVYDRTRQFFRAFPSHRLEASPDLARHIVYGAVHFARDLGFEPHPEFEATCAYLGSAPEQCAITFGHNGKPLYISGPDDDPRAVVATLTDRVGAGNFEFLTHVAH